MCSNPDRALSKIKGVHASARRAEGKVDLHALFAELAHKPRVEKRFLSLLVISLWTMR